MADRQLAQHQAAIPAKCVTCESLQQGPIVCEACHAILAHVQSADYFELFGLPRSYRLAEDDLDRRYRAISRNIHPDRFVAAGAEMQVFALRTTAVINRAYEVLRDPVQRAEYLLESAGGPSAAEDKRVPDGLLARVMMLREEIEAARAGGDEGALQEIREALLAEQSRTDQEIRSLCEKLESGSVEAKEQLRLRLNAMKYYNNLLAQS